MKRGEHGHFAAVSEGGVAAANGKDVGDGGSFEPSWSTQSRFLPSFAGTSTGGLYQDEVDFSMTPDFRLSLTRLQISCCSLWQQIRIGGCSPVSMTFEKRSLVLSPQGFVEQGRKLSSGFGLKRSY